MAATHSPVAAPMPYAIQTIDKPGRTQLRADKRPECLL
jgi:hypothetical protein